MAHSEKQTYLLEILQRKFDSELCTEDEAIIIICLLKDNGINTVRIEMDFSMKFDNDFELIK